MIISILIEFYRDSTRYSYQGLQHIQATYDQRVVKLEEYQRVQALFHGRGHSSVPFDQGRINFLLQLERYGKYSEQRYRIQFEKPFDFMVLSSGLVKQQGNEHHIIALDPSFIAKSGRKTPGIGYFWSGQAARIKSTWIFWGAATIDVDNRTGFHLDACQTLTGHHPEKSLVAI